MVRDAVIVARVVNAMQAPRLSGSSTETQTVESSGNRLVAADFGKFADQFNCRLTRRVPA